MTDPGGPGQEPRPWWDKALDPFRTEEAMFRVLVWVLAFAVVVVLIKAIFF